MCSLEPANYRSSSTYLPPSFGRRTSSLSSTYLPPRSSNTYSSAQSSYNQQHRGHQSSYQPRQDAYQISSYQPSQVYNSVSSSTYLPPLSSISHQSSSVPSNRYIPSSLKDSYSLPEVSDVHSSSLLSSSYGLPGYGRAHFRGHHRHNHEVSLICCIVEWLNFCLNNRSSWVKCLFIYVSTERLEDDLIHPSFMFAWSIIKVDICDIFDAWCNGDK